MIIDPFVQDETAMMRSRYAYTVHSAWWKNVDKISTVSNWIKDGK